MVHKPITLVIFYPYLSVSINLMYLEGQFSLDPEGIHPHSHHVGDCLLVYQLHSWLLLLLGRLEKSKREILICMFKF